MASEHHAGLPVLRRHALVAQTRETLEAAAPHQVTVNKRLFRNINPEAQHDSTLISETDVSVLFYLLCFAALSHSAIMLE